MSKKKENKIPESESSTEELDSDLVQFFEDDLTVDTDKAAETASVEKKGSFWKNWLLPLAITIGIAFFIRIFIGGPTTVRGSSMLPTLKNGDVVIVSKLSTYFKNYKRGDVVILDAPDRADKELYIKRIIGLPGETVEIRDGKIYINGMWLQEFYLSEKETGVYNASQWKLGQNEYFVMGDNRKQGASNDSRLFGPVSVAALDGKALWCIWPISDWKPL